MSWIWVLENWWSNGFKWFSQIWASGDFVLSTGICIICLRWNLWSQLRVNICICCRNVCFYMIFTSIWYCLTSKREPPPSPASCLFLLLDSTFSFGLYVGFGFSRAVGWTEGQMAPIWSRRIKPINGIPNTPVIVHGRASLSSLRLETSFSSPDVPTLLLDTPLIHFYLFLCSTDWLIGSWGAFLLVFL